MKPDFSAPGIQLYKGDSLEIVPELNGDHDVAVTDPPYVMKMGGGGIADDREYVDDIKDRGLHEGFSVASLVAFKSWMVFCAKDSIVSLIQQAETQSLRWCLITWNKTNPTPFCEGNYLPDTEYIVHAFSKLPKCDYRAKSRWILGPVEKNSWDHPTVKPLYVMQRLLQTASERGHTVLDPYAGTGSTGIACIRMGRQFIGIEKEQKYFDMAVNRIEQELRQGVLL